ncbi:hypothetical protein GCM10027217_46300 [Pseudomaricurvus hydrocarbonicus]
MLWICVLLAVFLGAEAVYFLLFSDSSEPVSESPSVLTADKSLPQLVKISESSYDVITAAPLFDPLRKPVTSSAGKGNSLVVGEWRLTGVVKAEQKTRVMFQALDGTRLVTLDEGMFLDGWRITSVSDDRVTLDSENDSLEMVLPVNLSSENDTGRSELLSPKKKAASAKKKNSVSDKQKKQANSEVETNRSSSKTLNDEQREAKAKRGKNGNEEP